MKERLLLLRKTLKLNQENFGSRIELSKASISALEKGLREITDRTIKLICTEFNVNEEWLRLGEGEMFIENDSTIIAKLSSEYNLDSLDEKIIESYLKLAPQQRKVIKDYVGSIAKAIISDEETVATEEVIPEKKQNVTQNEDDSIEKELEAYRLELEAEKKGITSSVIPKRKESLG